MQNKINKIKLTGGKLFKIGKDALEKGIIYERKKNSWQKQINQIMWFATLLNLYKTLKAKYDKEMIKEGGGKKCVGDYYK